MAHGTTPPTRAATRWAAWPSTTTAIWSLRYGIFAMPTVANGIDMDWAFSRAHGQNGEFELRHSFVPQHKGTQRILFYANRAHMGTYREAVQDFLSGSDTGTLRRHRTHHYAA